MSPGPEVVPERVPPMREPETIHATCVLIGEVGILIRGEAGSGKSTLARQLIHDARQKQLFASLVSDDRTWIVERHGRLLARVVDSIAGRIEVRGAGLVSTAHEPSAVIRLVVDLTTGAPERLPERQDQTIVLCGVVVPRLRQQKGATLSGLLLSRCVGDTVVTL